MRTIFENKVVPCLSVIETKSVAVFSTVVPKKGHEIFTEGLILSSLEHFGLTGELVIQVDPERPSGAPERH